MTSTIIGIIGTVLGGLDLVALISIILFYKPNRKAKDIENATHGNEALQSVIATLREQLERSDADSKAKQDKIDELTAEIANKDIQLAAAEFENTKNCFWKCNVKGCERREPPNGL